MPYSLRGNHPGCPGWAVVNTTTGNLVPGGCHKTKADAVRHLRALYKQVGTPQDLALNMQFEDVPGGMMGVGAAADDAEVMALAHEKVGHTEQGLWHHKGMQLPAFIQHIANDLIQERGMDTSRAVATAISQCKKWAAGGKDVKPETRAKAAEAIAEWERLKTQSKAAAGEPAPPAAPAGEPAPPALVTIPGVDILAAGTWELSTGRQTFTPADLASAIEAAKCPAVGNPLIKIGHLDDRFTPQPQHDGEPALGRVMNLRLTTGGNKVAGDLAGMPGWLGQIAGSAFPRRSVEGKYRFRCQVGHEHPFVITALALLGVTPPGVGVLGGLGDIADLYGVHAAGEPGEAWCTQPTEQEGPLDTVTEEDVRRAYYATAGLPPSYWITELQMAPTQLIVADEQSGRVFRVPFTINGSAVAFGDAAEVEGYQQVAAGRGSGMVMAWGSAGESRSVTAQTMPMGMHGMGMFQPSDNTDQNGLDSSWDNTDGIGDVSGLTVADLEAALAEITAELAKRTGQPSAAATEDGDLEAAAVGTGARFKALTTALSARGAHDPAALAAWIGRRKYGKAAFQALSARARKKKTRKSQGLAASGEFAEAAGNHGPHTGEHAHPHSAMGAQGGDQTHDHGHRHNNDAVHAHAHDPVSSAPGPAAPTASTKEGGSELEFTDKQLAAIRAKLGKKDGEEVTPAEIAATFTDAPVVTASAGQVPAPDEGNGMYLVDSAIIEDYRKRAEAADALAAEIRRRDRDDVLASAVRDGKFPKARLEHYQAMWNKDPDGTRAHVEHLAKGMVPVGGPVGVPGIDPDLPGDTFEEQQAYRKLYPEEFAKGGRR